MRGSRGAKSCILPKPEENPGVHVPNRRRDEYFYSVFYMPSIDRHWQYLLRIFRDSLLELWTIGMGPEDTRRCLG